MVCGAGGAGDLSGAGDFFSSTVKRWLCYFLLHVGGACGQGVIRAVARRARPLLMSSTCSTAMERASVRGSDTELSERQSLSELVRNYSDPQSEGQKRGRSESGDI